MLTPISRQGSHLPAPARKAAAHLRQVTTPLIALICALLASAAVIPAASAAELVREAPGGAPLALVPAPTVRAVTVTAGARRRPA
jgi:hypothetical protein